MPDKTESGDNFFCFDKCLMLAAGERHSGVAVGTDKIKNRNPLQSCRNLPDHSIVVIFADLVLREIYWELNYFLSLYIYT